MGVQGLWDLLAPVGRRVSVETLAGKKLAIDASIWMVQFIKAMRDEKGEMVRNAHILGFFRRICKLLFLRTKPVFVFDGGTPALKRRTVAARRRHRENARAKIRKTAEKLLLNHLKAKKLEELATELGNSNQKANAKGKQVLVDGESSLAGMSLEETHGMVDGAALQEKLDELLAASLAAEEEGKFVGSESSSAVEAMEEEDNNEDEEEIVFPAINGNVDPTVLASLPPSIQLDLLVQMRERLMAENRQKYQKIKKMPTKFSELQIQSYLKTVAFRREIDGVQKAAAGRGMGGVQTSRIASESNREFIFSSSFTGDKQMLTSAGVENNGVMTSHTSEKELTLDSGSPNSSTNQLKFVSRACVGEHFKKFGDDVETFYDERGHIRVSRVRGLGLRMTRDLQRNLDLMKQHEYDNNKADDLADAAHIISDGNSATVLEKDAPIRHETSNVSSERILEISFSKDGCAQNAIADDLFSNLVAGGSTSTFPFGITPSEDLSDKSESDVMWEEGKAGNDVFMERELSHGDSTTLEEDEVDWEEGVCDIPVTNFPCQTKNNITISRGNLEEETDLQEAIRRSLEDLQHGKPYALNEQTLEAEVNPSFVPCNSTSRQSCSPQSLVNGIDQLDDSARQDSINSSWKQFSSFTVPEGKYDVKRQMLLVSSDTCTSEKGLEKSCVAEVLSHETKALHPSPQETQDNQNSRKEALIRDKGNIITQHNHYEELPRHGTDIKGHLDVAMEVSQKTVDKTDKLGKLAEILQAPANQANPFEDQIEMQQDFLGEVNHMEAMKAPNTFLDEEISHLRQEREQIGDEQRKLERNAESVSSEMFAECQELLQMFGLPYIIAPMEAEAQCAHMELINLVDGVVTDDSDVFLFGARSIYKNIFDDRKYVETYFMKDIETELGLTQEKLIRMALLLGSDYTEGVSGIGIVNAIEVVNAFPEDDGLQKFKEWIESPDPSILGKLDPHTCSSKALSRMTGTNDGKLGNNIKVPSDDSNFRRTCEQDDSISEAKKIFMNKHRNISKNWHIPPSFPSESVVSAYLTPQVDESTESFSWGKPDLSLLRKLCWERFGWSNQKAEELLVPVLKEYNKHETQLRLEAFYTFNERFAKIRSQRIKRAVKGITGNLSVELSGDIAQTSAGSQKGGNSRTKQSQSEEKIHSGRITEKQFKRNRPLTKSSEVKHMELLDEKQNRKRGRGTRGRGSLRVKLRRKGKGTVGKEQKFDSTDSNSSDSEGVNSEKPVEVTKSIAMPRRSTRKQIRHNYTEELGEADGLTSPSDGRNSEEPNEVAAEKERVEDHEEIQGMDNENPKSLEEESMPMNYLSSGGGFCLDEHDLSQELIQKSSSPERAASVSFLKESESSERMQKSDAQKPLLTKDHAELVDDGKSGQGGRGRGVKGSGHYSGGSRRKQKGRDANCGSENVESTEAIPILRRSAKRQKHSKDAEESIEVNILTGSSGSVRRDADEIVAEKVLVVDDASVPEADGLQNCRFNSLEENMPADLIGGGFCINDEDSLNVEPMQKASSPGRASSVSLKTNIDSMEITCNLNTGKISSEGNLKPCSEKTLPNSSAGTGEKNSVVNEATSLDTENSQRECELSGLRAMPSLRRRRKKF